MEKKHCTSILLTIHQKLASLSNRQQSIGNYILSNHEEAAFLTSTEMAKNCNTSEATVIRFAVQIGFKKYGAMQNELRKLVRGKLLQVERLEQSNPTNSGSTMMDVARHWLETDRQSLSSTLAGLNEEDLKHIVFSIIKAGRVFVIASHAEYGLACYFGHTLSWIRDNVYVLDGSRSMSYDKMYELNAADVVFGISFPPYPANTIRMLDIGKHLEAKIISITDGPTSELFPVSNYCLFATNRQLSFADNIAPAASLLSLLLALISHKDYDRAKIKLNKLREFWVNSGVYNNYKNKPY